MTEEEFKKVLQEWGVEKDFKNKKERLYFMYCVAEICEKRIEIIKISKSKCYRKIIEGKGLNTSKWATMRNYDNNLKSNKFEIIEANIV